MGECQERPTGWPPVGGESGRGEACHVGARCVRVGPRAWALMARGGEGVHAAARGEDEGWRSALKLGGKLCL
jgi:hypothetical protein